MATPADIARLRTLNALLAEALEVPPGEREAWFASLEGSARDLMPDLRAMLEQTDEAFLSRGVEVPGDFAGARGETPGDLVGPYRLLEPLGEGGMATVWLAERADGTMQRRVALKLPRLAWARGLAQRMAMERDILAGLEHPHIARLYDAGLTEEGRPWLAMEYVDGRPIDRFALETGADAATCLALFLQVCEAVSHAHARLVVHRDLKPSNILVTKAGSVRLLDFGVAKLLEGEGRPDPGLTQFHGRAYTPDYASPEQVRGEPLGAASDVYSLGVVLYELLAGQRPYRLKRDTRAALEEAVLEAEAPLASTRALTASRARALRGDLDTILDKALRKRSASRYASVEAFAQDIRRHLAGETVLARPQSLRYRASKFVSRNRWPLAAAGAIVAALATGITVAVGEAREADRQRALAVERARQTEAALEFASSVITDGIRGDERVSREDLLARATAIAEGRPGAAPDDILAAVDTVSGWQMSVGRHRDAEALLARSLAKVPEASSSEMYRVLTCRRGSALASLGRHDEGVALLMRTLEIPGLEPSAMRYCLQRRALVARYAGQAETALHFALRARAAQRGAEVHSSVALALLEAEVAFAYSLSGRPAEADRHYAESARIFEAGGRERSVQALTVFNNWGIALLSMGNPKDALVQLGRAREIAERYAERGEVPGYLLSNLGTAYLYLARLDEAEAAYESLLPNAGRSGDVNFEVAAYSGLAEVELVRGNRLASAAHLDAGERLIGKHQLKPGVAPVRRVQTTRVAYLIDAGRLDEARTLVDAVLAEYERARLKVGQLSISLRQRSLIHARQGRPDEALADAERSLRVAQEAQGAKPHSSFTGAAWLSLARLHEAAGRGEDSRSAAREAKAHLLATVGESHPLSKEAARRVEGPAR